MLELYSVKKLNRVSRKKEIWCWGIGKRFHEMFALYEGEPFLERISTLIDGRSILWNTKKYIGGRTFLIESCQEARRKWNPNVLFLITSDAYLDIYKRILSEFKGRQLWCFIYPQHYFSYTKSLLSFFRMLPLRRRLLFYTGGEPHENALAIVEYLQKEYTGKPYKLLFAGKKDFDEGRRLKGIDYLNPETLRLGGGLRESIRYCYLYATSRFLLYENQPLKKARKRQKLIYMNHGTLPLKNVKDVLRQPEEVDLCICPSQGCAEIYEEQYGLPANKHIYCMQPRTMYIKKNQNKSNKLFLREGKQVILWLPTFRTLAGAGRKDSRNSSPIPLLEKKENLERVNHNLEENGQVLWIKTHPREQERLCISQEYGNIKLLTDDALRTLGLVLQEILGDTAALLTDYSGIAFEYLLLDNPIGYVISDMSDYQRGFAFDNPFDYMPGEKIGTVEDLETFFAHVRDGADDFQAARAALKKRLFQENELQSGARELIQFLDRL